MNVDPKAEELLELWRAGKKDDALDELATLPAQHAVAVSLRMVEVLLMEGEQDVLRDFTGRSRRRVE